MGERLGLLPANFVILGKLLILLKPVFCIQSAYHDVVYVINT